MVPKLLPTTPVHRHVFPAAFVQVAVALAPTFKHVTERFERGSRGEADTRAVVASDMRRAGFIVMFEVMSWEVG